MKSLRGRLFAILVAATGLIWLCGIAWISLGAKAELEHVLDTRIQEAARMVISLVGNEGSAAIGAAGDSAGDGVKYERQLSCQIWALDGRLLARSGSAPEELLTDQPAGFSERMIRGERWRVYSIENPGKGVRVMIGDRLGQRDQLVADLLKGLVVPTLIIIPLLGGLIWASLGRGLRPLTRMAAELRARRAQDMSPVDAGGAPSEMKPLLESLNGLFVKVETARGLEREVTAFAAHELRTPLAGLKTQAQIARAAADPGVRQGALDQILVCVDRTARLVRQLLALARLDSGPEAEADEEIDLGVLLREMAEAARSAPGSGCAVRVEIDPALEGFMVRSNRELLRTILRNLHENALQHSPEGGAVSWRASPGGDGLVLEDEGPGIAEQELPQVFRRFFRGGRKTPTGCGLGLSIVEEAARRAGWAVTLENREDRSGLRVRLYTVAI